MTTKEDLADIRAIVAKLDPGLTAAEVSLWTGARLKAWAPKEGRSHSAETALPMLDAVDRKMTATHRKYKRNIEAALRHLRHAALEQDLLTTRLTSEQAQKIIEAETLAQCANCGRTVECTRADKLMSGRCRPCHEYARDHDGTERPKDLWVV